ncbi:hypothetical protein WME99_29315 [Sorangium sp. So ce136]|uniref:hypothetical protein n=1 Tax=Sorangium sp. So ce136 TaxID=3133284 RepID=UPI003F117421
MGTQLSTPTAILLGSAMIAAAVYLGLRHGPAAVAPDARTAGAAPPVEAGPGASAAPAERAAAPAPAPQSARAVPRDEVARQAALALDAHRTTLMDRCYKPAIAAKPEPRAVKYVFNITFDAGGRQIARGLIEDQETARPEVTACLVAALPPVAIPAPGVNVRVDVPFSLP